MSEKISLDSSDFKYKNKNLSSQAFIFKYINSF